MKNKLFRKADYVIILIRWTLTAILLIYFYHITPSLLWLITCILLIISNEMTSIMLQRVIK